MSFDRNVFINCPFDADYKPHLEVLLFTVIYCGFTPRVSELTDSGSTRLDNIVSLILGSRYSIHDLCRMRAGKAGDLARFNMPFELGMDIGIRRSGSEKLAGKKCLVLDVEKHRYQAALSDMSGNDIESYGGTSEKLVQVIRNWLNKWCNGKRTKGPALIWEDFNEFSYDLLMDLRDDGFSNEDIAELPVSEYLALAATWIERRKKTL